MRTLIEHQVSADGAARIRQPLRKLAAGRVQQQTWSLGAIRRYHHRFGFLELVLPVLIEIVNARRSPLPVQSYLMHEAAGPHLAAAGRLRFGNHGVEGRRLRHDFAAEDDAKAAVRAARPAAVELRFDGHRRWEGVKAE